MVCRIGVTNTGLVFFYILGKGRWAKVVVISKVKSSAGFILGKGANPKSSRIISGGSILSESQAEARTVCLMGVIMSC